MNFLDKVVHSHRGIALCRKMSDLAGGNAALEAALHRYFFLFGSNCVSLSPKDPEGMRKFLSGYCRAAERNSSRAVETLLHGNVKDLELEALKEEFSRAGQEDVRVAATVEILKALRPYIDV